MLPIYKVSQSRCVSIPFPLGQNKIMTSHLSEIIFFHDYALGEEICEKNFYPIDSNENIGSSSFFKLVDQDQQTITNIKMSTLEEELVKYNIEYVDLLCMDVQGYELNVLKGAGNFIRKIKYIITLYYAQDVWG